MGSEMEKLNFWVLVLTAIPHFLLAPLASMSISSQSITRNPFLPLYALGTQFNLTDSLTKQTYIPDLGTHLCNLLTN